MYQTMQNILLHVRSSSCMTLDSSTCFIHMNHMLCVDVQVQVFVNPYGGKGSGVSTWKQVAPLFELATIKVTVKSIYCVYSPHGVHFLDINWFRISLVYKDEKAPMLVIHLSVLHPLYLSYFIFIKREDMDAGL